MFEKASVQARGYFFVDHALKGGEAFENMQNQNKDDIFDMLRMVMKEKYVKFVSSAMDLAEATLNEDAINFQAVTEEVFHPEV